MSLGVIRMSNNLHQAYLIYRCFFMIYFMRGNNLRIRNNLIFCFLFVTLYSMRDLVGKILCQDYIKWLLELMVCLYKLI